MMQNEAKSSDCNNKITISLFLQQSYENEPNTFQNCFSFYKPSYNNTISKLYCNSISIFSMLSFKINLLLDMLMFPAQATP